MEETAKTYIFSKKPVPSKGEVWEKDALYTILHSLLSSCYGGFSVQTGAVVTT